MKASLSEKIRNKAEQAIASKIFPGCVIGMINKKGESWVTAHGRFTYDADSPVVLQDSIFDVASITKAIPTSSLALRLLGEGRLKLEDAVKDFIPELKGHFGDAVQIRHLLTQTLDYSYRLSEYKDKDPDDILKVIFESDLRTLPGETYYYSNATSILLGIVTERVYGESLDILGKKYFFDPLGMENTAFNASGLAKERILPTEICGWRGRVIQGEIHDESAYKLSLKRPVGSAGLFSTAKDLLKFLKMLLNEGQYEGFEILPQQAVQQIYKNVFSTQSFVTGLGWELAQKRYMGLLSTPWTFGKTGFTGCVVMCDLSLELGIVILSNYSFPKRKPSTNAIHAFRGEIADLIFADVAARTCQ